MYGCMCMCARRHVGGHVATAERQCSARRRSPCGAEWTVLSRNSYLTKAEIRHSFNEDLNTTRAMYGAGESSAASWLGSLPKGLEGLPVDSVKARELSRSAYHALGKLCLWLPRSGMTTTKIRERARACPRRRN